MAHQVTCFSDAYSAWENWNLTGYEQRSAAITSFTKALSQKESATSAVCSYHLEKSEALLAKTHLMRVYR